MTRTITALMPSIAVLLRRIRCVIRVNSCRLWRTEWVGERTLALSNPCNAVVTTCRHIDARVYTIKSIKTPRTALLNTSTSPRFSRESSSWTQRITRRVYNRLCPTMTLFSVFSLRYAGDAGRAGSRDSERLLRSERLAHQLRPSPAHLRQGRHVTVS